MSIKIHPSWKKHLASEFKKPYFQTLSKFIKEEYKNKTIYPPAGQIFSAFNNCSFDGVKVVILGQDPYHGDNQANGLCFSVADDVQIPPSLLNIYKEIQIDVGKSIPQTGNLERWAKQGVLLLNATLTVEAHKAGSHQDKGWEEFTDAVVNILSKEKENLVFILWGAYAQRKGAAIDKSKHLVLQAAHPSPFAAHKGFFGCRHFSHANEYLKIKGKEPIDW